MKLLVTPVAVAQELALAVHKPLLYIGPAYNYDGSEIKLPEAIQAAPYLGHNYGVLYEGAVIICENDAEQERLYEQTVGDDGPTGLNPYNGPVRIYACTISREGIVMMENT